MYDGISIGDGTIEDVNLANIAAIGENLAFWALQGVT
jgi:hypothetical protein